MPERTRAALRLLEFQTRHPQDIDGAFVDGLRADGLDDLAIRETANIGFHFNMINRCADAFDFELPSAKGKARLARILSFVGRRLKGSYADPVATRGPDGVLRPTEVHVGWTHLLTADGHTTEAQRRAVDAATAGPWGTSRDVDEALPEAWAGYLDKLSRHAYRIIDEDVEALLAAGFDKDVIYEITVVGAFGAALPGLERVFAGLDAQ